MRFDHPFRQQQVERLAQHLRRRIAEQALRRRIEQGDAISSSMTTIPSWASSMMPFSRSSDRRTCSSSVRRVMA